jgi:uncharacterized protein YbjQ (UPF0145 family)
MPMTSARHAAARFAAAMFSAFLLASPAALAQNTPAALIALSEQDIPGRAYTVVGELRAEHHQTSLFPKKTARETLDDDLRAQAAKLGADAVVLIRYTSSNPMISKKGSTAIGKAVKFVPLQPNLAPAPVTPIVVEAPPPVAAPAPPAVVAPAAVAPPAAAPPAVAALQPAPVAPAPAPGPAVRGPAPAALIVLSEQDIAGRAYAVLGAVTAEAHQTSLFPKKSAREMLDEQLRAEAVKLGADAVIMIKYASSNPMTSKKGSTAAGVAVKFR